MIGGFVKALIPGISNLSSLFSLYQAGNQSYFFGEVDAILQDADKGVRTATAGKAMR